MGAGDAGAGLFVGLGLAAAAWLGGQALVESRAPQRVVTVKGLAERDVEADVAAWRIAFKASRAASSSARVRPIAAPPSTAAEAWPSAQAFTSWPKPAIRSPSSATSTVTVEPHSGERRVAEPSGRGSRSACGMSAASARMRFE